MSVFCSLCSAVGTGSNSAAPVLFVLLFPFFLLKNRLFRIFRAGIAALNDRSRLVLYSAVFGAVSILIFSYAAPAQADKYIRVEIKPSSGGNITLIPTGGGSPQTYKDGDVMRLPGSSPNKRIYFTAEPNEGYKFENWTIDGFEYACSDDGCFFIIRNLSEGGGSNFITANFTPVPPSGNEGSSGAQTSDPEKPAVNPQPEEPVFYALPEDEIGAYVLLPDGTKEYLLFQTYDICMSWLSSDELCKGPQRCYHKDGK